MTDREQWRLRGPVHTCRVERIWGILESDQRGDTTALEFRAEGLLTARTHQNPDDSTWTSIHQYDDSGRLTAVRHENGAGERDILSYEYDSEHRLARVIARPHGREDRLAESYEYDAEGRKKKSLHIDPAAFSPDTACSWNIEGTDACYSAPGATTLTTFYNGLGQPIEVVFSGMGDQPLSRVAFTHDSDGNLTEEAQNNLARQLPPALLATFNAAQLEALARFQIRRTHRYDEHGRRIESRMQMGPLGGHVTTTDYNDHGDPIRQIDQHESQEFGVDEEGQFSAVPASKCETQSESRFHYEYDERGNWVTKAMEGRAAPDQGFTVSGTERRTITYYE